MECIIHSRKSFPQKGKNSKILGSNTILLGNPSPYFNIKRIFFKSYSMLYIGTANTLNRRIISSIALSASNEYGGHFFMSQYTGIDIHSNYFVELPIDNKVVKGGRGTIKTLETTHL